MDPTSLPGADNDGGFDDLVPSPLAPSLPGRRARSTPIPSAPGKRKENDLIPPTGWPHQLVAEKGRKENRPSYEIRLLDDRRARERVSKWPTR